MSDIIVNFVTSRVVEVPFTNVVVIGAQGSTPPPAMDTPPWDGASVVLTPASGDVYLRNQTTGQYHTLRVDLVDGVAAVGCGAAGAAFGALPLPSVATAPSDSMWCVLDRAAGKLFGRSTAGLWHEIFIVTFEGEAVVVCSDTGVPFSSLPAYNPIPATPVDGWDAIWNDGTGRLFLRNRNASSNHYHELTIANVDGFASAGCLTVGVSFATAIS